MTVFQQHELQYFMFMLPCIVTNFFLIKPTDAQIFPNLFLSRNSTCLEKLVHLLVLLQKKQVAVLSGNMV